MKKTLLLILISLSAASQTYHFDSASLFIESNEEWVFSRKVAKSGGITFHKNKVITFFDLETDVKMNYSTMTDLGEALRFDFIETGVWVVLIFQKDFSQYQTYYRNRDCTAIKTVYSISKR